MLFPRDAMHKRGTSIFIDLYFIDSIRGLILLTLLLGAQIGAGAEPPAPLTLTTACEW